jgi:hypothetical protein
VILYYALGGGLGHLTRARAVVHTLGLRDVTLLTASSFAGDPRVTGGLPVITVPLELAIDLASLRAWLAARIARLAPEALYLDAFPAGIRGELSDLPLPAGLPIHYLARRLHWAEYRASAPGPLPPLAVAHILEPLAGEHERFVRAQAGRVQPLMLQDPPAELSPADRALVAALTRSGRPLWLIIHSDTGGELAELLGYADDLARLEGVSPVVAVVAPRGAVELPAGVAHLDIYPATPLFPLVDRLITAAGFNVMRQAAPYRARHHCLPFARRFDDQFARAALWREGRWLQGLDGR